MGPDRRKQTVKAKIKWHDSWLLDVDINGDSIGEWCRKQDFQTAKCAWCVKSFKFNSQGFSGLKKHARSETHKLVADTRKGRVFNQMLLDASTAVDDIDDEQDISNLALTDDDVDEQNISRGDKRKNQIDESDVDESECNSQDNSRGEKRKNQIDESDGDVDESDDSSQDRRRNVEKRKNRIESDDETEDSSQDDSANRTGFFSIFNQTRQRPNISNIDDPSSDENSNTELDQEGAASSANGGRGTFDESRAVLRGGRGTGRGDLGRGGGRGGRGLGERGTGRGGELGRGGGRGLGGRDIGRGGELGRGGGGGRGLGGPTRRGRMWIQARGRGAMMGLRTAAEQPVRAMRMSLTDQVEVAEIRMALKVVESNYSYQSMDNMAEILRSMDPKSDVFQKYAMKHSKISALISHGLYPHFLDKLIKSLLEAPGYSFGTDASTFHQGKLGLSKHVDFVFRFWDEKFGGIVDRFAGYASIGKEPADVQVREFLKFLDENGIPLVKMLSMSRDNPNVMKKAFRDLEAHVLAANNPKLIDSPCYLHPTHTAFQKCEEALMVLESVKQHILYWVDSPG